MIKLKACGHYFHRECLEQWVTGQAVAVRRNGGPRERAMFRPNCPLCRTPLDGYRVPDLIRNSRLLRYLPSSSTVLMVQLIPLLAILLPLFYMSMWRFWLNASGPAVAGHNFRAQGVNNLVWHYQAKLSLFTLQYFHMSAQRFVGMLWATTILTALCQLITNLGRFRV